MFVDVILFDLSNKLVYSLPCCFLKTVQRYNFLHIYQQLCAKKCTLSMNKCTLLYIYCTIKSKCAFLSLI